MLSTLAAIGTTLEWTRTALLGILGYGLLAGVGALALAFAYRASTVRQLPAGPAALAGLALPTGALAIEAVRHGRVIADSPLGHYTTGSYLLGMMVVGTAVAAVGHRLGDHLACGAYGITPIDARGPVADLVESAGLSATVPLPDSIDDAEGYPPVDEAVKRELESRELRFPGGLSISERRTRLDRRLEADYDVGYARAELGEDGSVTALALGDRRTGLSPTLGPDRVAVAVAGDRSAQASTGDPVTVWTADGDSSRLVATGILRSSAGSVTTLVVDADDADAFEPGSRYRLTIRPETPSGADGLCAAIRTADETVASITVEDGGSLEGEFAGWVPGTVLVIDRAGEVIPLPAENEPLAAGDTIYVFGTPGDLETFETLDVGGGSPGADDGVDAEMATRRPQSPGSAADRSSDR
ncbi:TrkA C-terminal domain-containing protein [Natronorubrum halalkaliphilum]|uniref:TrkA C-terminal domain-containing protein n=1 Tax=Natronorubrum halalkaliphilum TaxID=2691917 RepID=UPI001915CB30|nr:TrkA C-terminal domain-containing protein [Natronorubrum halalkaliphilum]